MSTTDVAKTLVTLCRDGKFDDAMNQLYADNIVSVEPQGPMLVTEGLEAVRGKAEWWNKTYEVKKAEVSEPRINGDSFMVDFKIDTKHRETGEEDNMRESAVYKVADGKIVHETFFM